MEFIVMKTIHKYRLSPITEIYLPIGSTVLNAGEQDGDLFIWVMLDTDSASKANRTFYVFPTGGEIKNQYGAEFSFVGTVQMNGGLVFHIFEII